MARAFLASLLLLPSAAWAQTVPAPYPPAMPGDVIALSPLEREQAIEAGIAKAREAELSGAAPRTIHGEMGIMMGTGGTRGAYGVATMPLGDTGSATIGFEDYRAPRWPR